LLGLNFNPKAHASSLPIDSFIPENFSFHFPFFTCHLPFHLHNGKTQSAFKFCCIRKRVSVQASFLSAPSALNQDAAELRVFAGLILPL
jgi:hypothetical protein